MKKLRNIQIPLVILILISLSFSCSKTAHKNETVFLSENGILLANNAINAYEALNTALRAQEYDNEMIRILNDPSPATYVMQMTPVNAEFIKNNIQRQAAFRLFKKAFTAYNLFLDNNFNYSSSNLQSRLYAAASALDTFKINDYFNERVQILKKQILAVRFNEKASMMELTLLYGDLWNTDLEKLYLLLENDLENYKKGMNDVNNGLFNKEKVAKLVDQPFNNGDVLINLYKLQLVKNKQEKTAVLTEKLQNVSTAFEYLSDLNAEMAKKRKNKEKIHRLNEELESMLSN